MILVSPALSPDPQHPSSSSHCPLNVMSVSPLPISIWPRVPTLGIKRPCRSWHTNKFLIEIEFYTFLYKIKKNFKRSFGACQLKIIYKLLASVLVINIVCIKQSTKLLPACGSVPNPFICLSLYTSFTIKLKCSSPEGTEEKNEKKAMMKHSSPASSTVRYSQSHLHTRTL